MLMPVLLLLFIKMIYFLNVAGYNGRFSPSRLFTSAVSAQEEKAPAVEQTQGTSSDNATQGAQVDADFGWNFDLVKALHNRQSELNVRAEEMKRDEERLNRLKKEIEARMQQLAQVEKNIGELVAQKKAIEEEKVYKLAKVFEATPPEQAGPLMSKLDVDIAAELLLKMQGRKAGRIWGYVEPDKAVLISQELARLDPEIDMEKMSRQ